MNDHGWSFKEGNTLFYFGSKILNEDSLKKYFPQFKFKKNKQVHSNIVINAEQSPQNADGLWTTEKNVAVVSVTADCVPVLLSNGKKVFSLHAGWRGVASDIVGSAFETLSEQEKKDHWFVYIGPSIKKQSFDIKRDTLEPLAAAWGKVSTDAPPTELIGPEQWRFDLYALLMAQLRFYFHDNITVHHLDLDTKQDLRFHSYRRDKDKAGRNFSFVVLERD